MMNINGKKYVKGYTEVSPAAVDRLTDLGVVLHYSSAHGGYDSFFLPFGHDGGEFLHKPGSPSATGSLCLKSEAGE